MHTWVVDGRAAVVREVRAAAPLLAERAVPLPARGPWLTAALNAQAGRPFCRVRPHAVVVERDAHSRPAGAALLSFRRRGVGTVVGLLGAEPGPLPPGRPQSRFPAQDDDVAERLAAGVIGLLDQVRGPWTLRLAGLPLGDPTVRHLAAGLPDAQLATTRSRRLIDELDSVADVSRSRDPGEVERWLPAVLAQLPPAQRTFVRAAARLHAAIGELEVAVVPADDGPRALLLTLLDRGAAGEERWPWWGTSEIGGLRRELGAPSGTLTAAAGLTQLGRRGALSRGAAAG
ncbi:hypothetical protein O2W15_13055 [Modestobacter sp. VKM Ac-2979]|uniref:hypothetical protein n=1 Tax=unclassified Modestobacter TaxID=2643866 RepID=UPI0022AB9DAA|nr:MULTISPECIES: hypothetical protein [unclassified Modestobacter]MCZ2812363.1 hypothetical protein [Modestobacter sp. VKM Ac-2979]MCZ2841253.1 hypothetical protein [Modestobacter sp. VKM Ac-2980]